MANNRDEKFEKQEEGEYHFSDEETNYDAEVDETKTAGDETSDTKLNILNRLTRSKRMLISMVIFFVLIFIVYKMVSSDTSSAPSTDIAATSPSSAVASTSPAVAVQQQPATATPTTSAMAMAPASQPPQMQPSYQSMQQQPGAQQPMTTTMMPTSSGMPSSPTTAATTSTYQQQPPAMMTPLTSQSMPGQLPSSTMMTSPADMQQQQPPSAMQQTMQPPTTQSPVTSLQNMATMMGAPPSVTGQQSQQQTTMMSAMPMPAAPTTSYNQLQMEYTQKLNDFFAQNKILQDQIQTLNARVMSMEAQMNQMMQMFTRYGQDVTNNNMNNMNMNSVSPPQSAPPPMPDPKIAYSVQAIIPGRAWLRSDSGETVTVAEGDTIKDLGRITKIDPYDGVVEINTGNKVVSLSYGSGG